MDQNLQRVSNGTYFPFQNVERTVQRAMHFLDEQDINTLREDPYALSVITYALALSNSTRKMTFYENLKDIAGRSSGKGIDKYFFTVSPGKGYKKFGCNLSRKSNSF